MEVQDLTLYSLDFVIYRVFQETFPMIRSPIHDRSPDHA